jgi:hypothetical protein
MGGPTAVAVYFPNLSEPSGQFTMLAVLTKAE